MKRFTNKTNLTRPINSNKSNSVCEHDCRSNSTIIQDLNPRKSNETIVNYGRFVSTNHSKSRLMKSFQVDPLYLCNSKNKSPCQTKSFSENLLTDGIASGTDKTNHKSESCISKIESQNKSLPNSLNIEKSNSMIETGKFHISKRKRNKSIDNEELRKLIGNNIDQSPKQMQTTINKWLKETLPTIILDNDICKPQCSLHPKQKIGTRKRTMTLNSMKTDYSKLELFDFLGNLSNTKSLTKDNAMNLYHLLQSLYDSLKSINTKPAKLDSMYNLIKKLFDEKQRIDTVKQENRSGNYMGTQSDSDLSSLDDITRSSIKSIPKMLGDTADNQIPAKVDETNFIPKTGCVNQKLSTKDSTKKSLNRNLISTIEKEINLNQPVRVNSDKLLIGDLLSMPKVEIKSKCVVGIYKNFIEEQYVISGFREISKQERITFLKNEIKKKKSFQRLVHLTTNCSANIECRTRVVRDQSVQTVDKCPYDNRNHCHQSQIFRDVASQTCYFNDSLLVTNFSKATINKDDEPEETLSWQSDNLSNDELFYQLEKEINSPILFDDNVTRIAKADITKVSSNIYNMKNEYHNANNQNIVQQATIEYFICPSLLIEYDIMEMSTWTAHASKVKSHFKNTIENANKHNLQKSELIKCSTNREMSKLSKLCDIPLKTNFPNDSINGSLPPCGPSYKFPKSATLSMSNEKTDGKMLSELEHSCQDIKDSLTKDIPLPENLNNLYERLSKLQKMLEGIPEGKIHSTLEALDQLNSSGSNSPEFMNKFDCSCTNYIEKDQYPTSLGDCNEKRVFSEFPTDPMFSNASNLIDKSNINLLNFTNSKTNKDSLRMKKSLSTTYDDDQSEVTNSLSMLENLIDDFLLKNGLSNISNI